MKIILKSFETSELKENRDGFLNFHLKSNSINTLSKIFSLIEENKLTYTIEYYGVSQTNIEQIFLNFASKQIDSKNRKVKNFKKLNKFKDVL